MDYQNNQSGKSGSNTFHLTADMFPEGMAKTLKAGEVIEFRIVSPLDKDGDVEVEYNYGDSDEKSEGTEGTESTEEQAPESSWEDDFRQSMSPQAPEEGAM